MKSPFPGMDPFIEACGQWEGFHNLLIARIAERLAAAVPARYVVRPGERSYVLLVEPGGPARHAIVPDVGLASSRGRKRSARQGGTAVQEPAGAIKPVTLRAFVEEEHRESFIEIQEIEPGRRLVTTVEVLSPTNKRPGTEGWDLYQRKRQSVLLAGVNLVEIDLLLGGQRMPMADPWPDTPYALLVARANQVACKVWPVPLQSPLPPLPVPLAKPDPDVTVELQPMIRAIY
jgi:hypothetical protein